MPFGNSSFEGAVAFHALSVSLSSLLVLLGIDPDLPDIHLLCSDSCFVSKS